MSLLVAVFNENSDWSGKTITYEDARHQFILQDRGAVSAEALLGYDAQGQLDWTDEGLREWTQRAAQAAAVTAEPAPPSTEAAAAASPGGGEALADRAARLSATHDSPPGAEVSRPPLDAASPSSSRPPLGARPEKKVGHTGAGALKAASAPGRTPASEKALPGPVGLRPTAAAQAALAEAGFICSLFGFGVPLLGVLGLMLSLAARRQAQRLGTAKGLSTAGIVLGVISTVVGLLLVLVVLVG
jgi:pyruvate/2-oxoglutarate dehydrogenase complex dihydrolipoamide acyltransferase (E2) component